MVRSVETILGKGYRDSPSNSNASLANAVVQYKDSNGVKKSTNWIAELAVIFSLCNKLAKDHRRRPERKCTVNAAYEAQYLMDNEQMNRIRGQGGRLSLTGLEVVA